MRFNLLISLINGISFGIEIPDYDFFEDPDAVRFAVLIDIAVVRFLIFSIRPDPEE